MIFLIDYDRKLGRIIKLETYQDSEQSKASASRLSLELAYHRQGIEREVVLLEAANEQAIRRTHRRYFADLAELARLPETNGE
jgi:hypothetical protein